MVTPPSSAQRPGELVEPEVELELEPEPEVVEAPEDLARAEYERLRKLAPGAIGRGRSGVDLGGRWSRGARWPLAR